MGVAASPKRHQTPQISTSLKVLRLAPPSCTKCEPLVSSFLSDSEKKGPVPRAASFKYPLYCAVNHMLNQRRRTLPATLFMVRK
jgi:hypothetical protein